MDAFGRDTLLRLVSGCRVSFTVGCAAALLALGIGTAVGLLSGYFGGSIDRCLMGCVDVLYALPLTLIVLLFLVFIGSGTCVLILAIGLSEWFTLARVLRATTLELRCRTFIQAARAIGQSHLGILCQHILPNLRPTLANYFLLLLPNAILMEAFLSFLGLGTPPPASSLGNMIVEALPLMHGHPLQLLLPSALLILTLLALHTLGRRET
jgi:oligopeptide transport system permease protein